MYANMNGIIKFNRMNNVSYHTSAQEHIIVIIIRFKESQLSDSQSKSFKFLSHEDKASTHAFLIYQLQRQFTCNSSRRK